MLSFLKSSQKGAFETALLLTLCLIAAARGGEARHLNWDEAIWDTYLAAVEVLWKESKTLNQYPLVLFNDSKFLTTDVYFLLGGYFAIENGLHCHDPAPITKKSMYIFPMLQKHPPAYTTSRVTSALREFVPEPIKHMVSSKSPRIGATTEMNIHPQMTMSSLLARTGHSAGNNTDHYNVFTPAGSLPGGKCLSGWPNIRAPVYPPTLTCFVPGSKEAALQDDFIDALYAISLPDFQRGGRLRGLLLTCTATIIMHFRDFDTNFKSGQALALRIKVLQALVDAKYFNSLGGALTAVLGWSAIVRKDFDSSNMHQYVGDSQSSNADLVCLLLASNMELKAKNKEINERMAAGFQEICNMIAQLTAAQNAVRGDIHDVKEAQSSPLFVDLVESPRKRPWISAMTLEREESTAITATTSSNTARVRVEAVRTMQGELSVANGTPPPEPTELT